MDWIAIQGVPPHDGRYPFDLAANEFTTREWSWIKKHAGYLPLTITDGFAGGDPELFTVFAVIALRRAGKIEVGDVPALVERFADVGFGTSIVLESDGVQEEAERLPPPSGTSSTSNGGSSGDGSTKSSETSTQTRPSIGDPVSAFSEFDPIRSAS